LYSPGLPLFLFVLRHIFKPANPRGIFWKKDFFLLANRFPTHFDAPPPAGRATGLVTIGSCMQAQLLFFFCVLLLFLGSRSVLEKLPPGTRIFFPSSATEPLVAVLSENSEIDFHRPFLSLEGLPFTFHRFFPTGLPRISFTESWPLGILIFLNGNLKIGRSSMA